MEKSSMTARICAFARACHTEWNQTAIFRDEPASALLTEEEKTQMGRHMGQGIGYFHPGFNGSEEAALRWVVDHQLSPTVLSRSAYAEEMLYNATRFGTRQYLILGAGLDSFAYRQPVWGDSLRIFEIDHPATADDKESRTRSAFPEVVSNLCRIPADFALPDWTAALLACKDFDPSAISFCSLLGLTYYLERETFTALLHALALLLPRGSSLVFDYPAMPGEDEAVDERHLKQVAMAQATGEPMCRDYGYPELETLLSDNGFLIYEHMDATRIEARYFTEYNAANPEQTMKPFGQVQFCLAVRGT